MSDVTNTVSVDDSNSPMMVISTEEKYSSALNTNSFGDRSFTDLFRECQAHILDAGEVDANSQTMAFGLFSDISNPQLKSQHVRELLHVDRILRLQCGFDNMTNFQAQISMCFDLVQGICLRRMGLGTIEKAWLEVHTHPQGVDLVVPLTWDEKGWIAPWNSFPELEPFLYMNMLCPRRNHFSSVLHVIRKKPPMLALTETQPWPSVIVSAYFFPKWLFGLSSHIDLHSPLPVKQLYDPPTQIYSVHDIIQLLQTDIQHAGYYRANQNTSASLFHMALSEKYLKRAVDHSSSHLLLTPRINKEGQWEFFLSGSTFDMVDSFEVCGVPAKLIDRIQASWTIQTHAKHTNITSEQTGQCDLLVNDQGRVTALGAQLAAGKFPLSAMIQFVPNLFFPKTLEIGTDLECNVSCQFRITISFIDNSGDHNFRQIVVHNKHLSPKLLQTCQKLVCQEYRGPCCSLLQDATFSSNGPVQRATNFIVLLQVSIDEQSFPRNFGLHQLLNNIVLCTDGCVTSRLNSFLCHALGDLVHVYWLNSTQACIVFQVPSTLPSPFLSPTQSSSQVVLEFSQPPGETKNSVTIRSCRVLATETHSVDLRYWRYSVCRVINVPMQIPIEVPMAELYTCFISDQQLDKYCELHNVRIRVNSAQEIPCKSKSTSLGPCYHADMTCVTDQIKYIEILFDEIGIVSGIQHLAYTT